MIYETFREAVKNIWSNKFRTVLTMLGIIIGVTAVIVIVGLGNGMTQSIKDSFSEMGTNVLSVRYRGQPPGGVHWHVAHHHAGQHREGGYHHLWLYERQGRE